MEDSLRAALWTSKGFKGQTASMKDAVDALTSMAEVRWHNNVLREKLKGNGRERWGRGRSTESN
jgi:hypothetical protein